MTPQEQLKQQSLADKLRKVDPFKLDPKMIIPPKKIEKPASIRAAVDSGEYYA
jgi:hypothetical protein